MNVLDDAIWCTDERATGAEPWPDLPPRDPRRVQADLHRIAADLLRLEAQIEDLAAEAAAGAAGGMADDGSRRFWTFLEAILAQLLIDNFGPLRQELRTAAVWQPAGETETPERVV